MKKLLMFFTVAMTTGCTIVDYNCNWDYKIDNQTGTDIVVEVERRDAVYKSTTIEVGDTQIFYNGNGHCGSGGVPQNIYPPEVKFFYITRLIFYIRRKTVVQLNTHVKRA